VSRPSARRRRCCAVPWLCPPLLCSFGFWCAGFVERRCWAASCYVKEALRPRLGQKSLDSSTYIHTLPSPVRRTSLPSLPFDRAASSRLRSNRAKATRRCCPIQSRCPGPLSLHARFHSRPQTCTLLPLLRSTVCVLLLDSRFTLPLSLSTILSILPAHPRLFFPALVCLFPSDFTTFSTARQRLILSPQDFLILYPTHPILCCLPAIHPSPQLPSIVPKPPAGEDRAPCDPTLHIPPCWRPSYY